ncbi:hypothetical protein JAAARDRAFT_209850 [Jaapia argillacea MUCL 33604]|uniref:EF-hand domain-containing protein n=1 Tax=Jaapia argillacea MUCL 33604 TaxID=933084 RepID=A0A067PFF2_9AGAM|nr:hypothetical protein JAAARDRAFT_209850 [Jaapia argillacea MUCL 33604]
MPSAEHPLQNNAGSSQVRIADMNYDAENGGSAKKRSPYFQAPAHNRGSSWDVLAGIKTQYEEFDSRNASQAHLAFAEGDIPKDKFSKLYNYLLNVSIVTRWILFIVPVMAILWIPGILGLTTFPHAEVWGVKLLWWSIWFSVLWGGWWAALATARILPTVARSTLGLVAVGSRRYIDWLTVLHRYVALFAWTLAIWIAYNPLIDRRQDANASTNSKSIVQLIAKLLFALYLCAALLAFEKFSIQWIAGKFHERSYAERITDQKFAIKVLTILYTHSSDIPGRSDTLRDRDGLSMKRASMNPKLLLKKAIRGVRNAATTTTTVLGNVASEMAGSSVLQPNSPEAKVKTALASANKSRLLARRLFYSFVKPGHECLFVDDIAKFFPTRDEADAAFALFDKDGNGDATRDEVDLACMECHREQLSIEHSMRDLDSAVGRLDNIFMSLYVIIAILIIAVALEAQLLTLITGAGTLLLGLSWLIGGSLQEVLTSIIFLFIKHPFDVGDRVDLTDGSFTVKEIRLLSTIFLDSNGTSVQAPNTILNTKFIQNIRRSPQMSETFKFEVEYSTTFEQLESLRDKMMAFLEAERRDYFPVFDVIVLDIPDQEKMALKVDIKYKSNFQQGALKAKRHNKWVCALKSAMAECLIYGPKGNPNPPPEISRHTVVPWEDVAAEDQQKKAADGKASAEPKASMPQGGWRLTDKNAAMADASQDIFGDDKDLRSMKSTTGTPTGLRSRSQTESPISGIPTPALMPPFPPPTGPAMEEIEMGTPRGATFPRAQTRTHTS